MASKEGSVIVLNLLRYQDEIIDISGLHLPEKVKVPKSQMELALELIDKLSASFDPSQYKDTYREKLEAIIESVLRIYANKTASKNITIHRQFQDCPPINGIESEIKQVVSNLISNAADAVASGGIVTIALECLEDRGKTTVHMTVEDDGPGVADEHRDRIFEPFFTTKQDVGTGLGLWVSREIIERHGGTIQLMKRENGARGAAFHVAFQPAPHAL